MHPVLFKIGPITVYSYGFMLAVAFLTAVFLAAKAAKREGIPPEFIIDLALCILFSGIIGARALFVLLNTSYYTEFPIEILKLHRGGLVFYGGAFSAFICSGLFTKKCGYKIRRVADLIVPYAALGHAIGRIGCFLNGCCFGAAAYPVQLYSSAFLLALYIFLRAAYSKRVYDGQVLYLYGIFYSAGRFLLEFLRADTPEVFAGLKLSQVLSAAVFFVSCALYFKKKS